MYTIGLNVFSQFVAHPNCQQHMTSIWYGSEMGFLQSLNGYMQFIYLLLFLPVIPFMCLLYIIAPGSKVSPVNQPQFELILIYLYKHVYSRGRSRDFKLPKTILKPALNKQNDIIKKKAFEKYHHFHDF